MDIIPQPPHDPKVDSHDAVPVVRNSAVSHALPICRAPLQGAEALGSIFVQQHPDGTLTIDGAWHATVRPCIPTGFLTITLTEITGWYWCLERDFSAAGFTVPGGCGSVQASTSCHATGEEAP